MTSHNARIRIGTSLASFRLGGKSLEDPFTTCIHARDGADAVGEGDSEPIGREQRVESQEPFGRET